MRFFQPHEFACGCGDCGRGYDDMQPELLHALDEARARAGTGFVLTSAIRCEAHNAAVGGVDSSAHVDGWAVDIAATNSRKRYKVLKGLIDAGFQRIGVAGDFIHADCDPSKPARVTWVY